MNNNFVQASARRVMRFKSPLMLLMLLAFACVMPVLAQTIPMSIMCTGSGQTCTPAFVTPITVNTAGPITIVVTASPLHCSNVSFIVSVDSTVVTTTAFLTPGQSSGNIVTSALSAGPHTVSVQGVGTVGGCNSGTLGGWSGTLNVSQPISGIPVPPTITLTLFGLLALGAAGFGLRKLHPAL